VVLIIVAGGFLWWVNGDTSKGAVVVTATTTVATTTTNSTDTEVDPVEKAYTQTRVLEKGVYVTIVNLTEEGFVPPIVYINKGEAVRFINKATDSMRVATNEFQSIPLYAGFGQEKSVGKGGTYAFTFMQKGVWGYNNMNGTPKVYGVVYVR
jgi:hypothetical protein